MTRLLSDTTRTRVAKCVRLLASDSDGEVLSAVRAVRAALAGEGRDLHTLADVITGTPTWARSTPNERLSWLRIIIKERISDGERTRMRALGIALKADRGLRPDRGDVRTFNTLVKRLYGQGVRR